MYRTSTLPTPKNTSSKELNTDSRSKNILNNLSQADLDDASVHLNFDDLPEMDINKFLSQQEDDSRRNVQSFENLSSTGQVSNSIGRMSFGRSKKQSNKKSQGTLNVSAVGNLPATAKKDYAAGLMAIEERLKPQMQSTTTEDKNANVAKARARDIRNTVKTTATLAELKTQRLNANKVENVGQKTAVQSTNRVTNTRNQRTERPEARPVRVTNV